jgi:hypothetical protein
MPPHNDSLELTSGQRSYGVPVLPWPLAAQFRRYVDTSTHDYPIMRVHFVAVGLVLITPALARAQAPSRATLEAAQVDSIVLERTVCFGTCPAYRLRLDATGRIHFQSRNPGEDFPPATDSISPAGLTFLQREASRIGFFTLPPQLHGTELCRDRATDHHTATVTFFTAAGSHAVRDYHGCFERADHSVTTRVADLRTFERQIDGVTGSFRWARPSRRR